MTDARRPHDGTRIIQGFAIVALLCTTAAASPIGVVWTQKTRCLVRGQGHIVANHDAFMWMDTSTSFKLERRARATGAVCRPGS